MARVVDGAVGVGECEDGEADAEEDGAVTPIDSGSDDTLTSDTTPVAETSVEVDPTVSTVKRMGWWVYGLPSR